MDKEIENYMLLVEYEDSFTGRVRELIKMGYKPFGSVSICQYGRGTKVAQSFVKYKKDE